MAERTIASFADEVKKDPGLRDELAADPAGTLAKYAYTGDRTFYRIAIYGLVGVVLIGLLGAIVLEVWAVGPDQPRHSLPDWAAALATTALGGLVGLFAPSPVK